jgi:pilus assembly protein Flp/PilA
VPRCGWVINSIGGGDTMNGLFLKMYVKFQELTSREDGQDLVEYALLLSLITLALITAVNGLTAEMVKIFNNITTSLN